VESQLNLAILGALNMYSDELAAEAIGKYGAMQKNGELAALIRFLYNMRWDSKCTTIVEIGSAEGGTLHVWKKFADDVISISLTNGPFGGLTPTLLENFFHIPNDSHDIRSKKVLELILNGKSIDFLFIDGDHTYEGVSQDFDMYSPLVKKGGWVGFHDICSHSKKYWPTVEVDQFWEELKLSNKNYVIKTIICEPRTWGGIGLIQI
jgi:hypothetical protein